MAIMIPKVKQKPAFKLGTTLDQLNAQKARAATQRNSAGWNQRRSQIDAAIGKFTPTVQIPETTQPTPVAAPTAPTTTATPAPVQPAAPNPMMRTTYDFVPRDMTQDPIYKFQKEQGLSELDQYLASKGLRQSGARDRAASRLIGQLGADAYGRQLNTAGAEADRFERMTQNESGRLERAGQNQFNNLMSVLQLGASQSPMAYGYDATENSANMANAQGKTLASFLSQLYPRYSGGGGGGSMPFIPPFASSPDFSAADYAAIQGGSRNNAGWGNTISNLLGGLFK